MERVEEFTLEGKNFMYIDFSGFMTKDDFDRQIAIIDPIIAKYPEQSLYTITNIENIRIDISFKEALIKYLERNKPHVKHGVIIGLDGVKKVILKEMFHESERGNMHFVFTKEQAITWLLQQD